MTPYIGLDVSQKMTAICVVDSSGRRFWAARPYGLPVTGEAIALMA